MGCSAALSGAVSWQKLNSSFYAAHPEAATLQSYPADWPIVECVSSLMLC